MHSRELENTSLEPTTCMRLLTFFRWSEFLEVRSPSPIELNLTTASRLDLASMRYVLAHIQPSVRRTSHEQCCERTLAQDKSQAYWSAQHGKILQRCVLFRIWAACLLAWVPREEMASVGGVPSLVTRSFAWVLSLKTYSRRDHTRNIPCSQRHVKLNPYVVYNRTISQSCKFTKWRMSSTEFSVLGV